MPFFQSQSEKHIRPGRHVQRKHRDYDRRKKEAEVLFRFWQEIIFWVVLLAAVFFVSYLFHFQGLVLEESMEIAVRGREIALGGDSPAGYIRPLYLRPGQPLAEYSFSSIPPLYPRIQAVFLKAAGFSDNSAVLAGCVFFLATVLLTYGLARRMLPKKTALFVFLFSFSNPVLLGSAISGLPTAFLTFLIVLIFCGWEILPARWAAGWGGLILGMGFLADYSFSLFLVAALLYLLIVLKQKQRWTVCGIFLAGFLAAISPWLIGGMAGGRSWLLTYLDYYWKSATVLLPGRTADGLFGFSLSSFSLPADLAVGKIHQGISLLYREGLTLSGNFLVLFFWGSLFFRPAASKLRRLRLFSVLLLIAAGIWFVVFRHQSEILVPVLPLVIISGTEFFFDLKERFGPRRRLFSSALTAGFILVNCVPIFLGRVPSDPLKPDMLNSLEYLKTLVREEELVVTDIPAQVSWYGNRQAVRLPLTPEMLEEMLKEYPGMKFLLLSPRIMERGDMDPAGRWSFFYRRSGLADLEAHDQTLLLPGRLMFLGPKKVLLNRISSRW